MKIVPSRPIFGGFSPHGLLSVLTVGGGAERVVLWRSKAPAQGNAWACVVITWDGDSAAARLGLWGESLVVVGALGTAANFSRAQFVLN